MVKRSVWLTGFVLLLIVILGIVGHQAILLAAVFTPVLYFVLRQFDQQPNSSSAPASWQEIVDTYGEPDDIILADPTRGSELVGVIMVYKGKQLVVGGKVIPLSDIDGVTFNNASLPYLVNDYQLVFSLPKAEPPYVRLPVGIDASWAAEVLERLSPYLPVQQD